MEPGAADCSLCGSSLNCLSSLLFPLPFFLSSQVNPTTGLLDYDKMEEKALEYRPRLLICGGSSYPRVWDFARCRRIADKCGAILMCDMAHISGLIAAGVGHSQGRMPLLKGYTPHTSSVLQYYCGFWQTADFLELYSKVFVVFFPSLHHASTPLVSLCEVTIPFASFCFVCIAWEISCAYLFREASKL